MDRSKPARWTREQLLVVLTLYHKLFFGQMDARQKVVIDLAERMGRSPNSVAMKLVNLASLDPVLKLRGIKGLPGTSKQDREMWDEFHSNPAELIPLAQEKFDALFIADNDECTEVIPGKGIFRVPSVPVGETEIIRAAKQRRRQTYFRDIILNNYDNHCALTALPVRGLLIASHILPWHSHPAERLNVRNGIALKRLHDAAFDQGLIGFDDDLKMIVSCKIIPLLSENSIKEYFAAYIGKELMIPKDGVPPYQEYLAEHRKTFGLTNKHLV